MNFKKTIAKSLVVAMALGMVPVANLQTAKAAADAITFDGEAGTATSNNAKYWGVAKVDAKGGKGSVKIGDKSYKISNIQEYAEGIDVYGALKGKAGIIVVGDTAVPDGDWKLLELQAADSTFKVNYIASTAASIKGLANPKGIGGENGYLLATIGKKDLKEVDLSASKAAIEVRQNEGPWKTVEGFFGTVDKEKVGKKLKQLGQNGSTLTFRVKGTATAWASKESKVKIPSQPKAPSAKVDVSKETTTIKKGMQYQVVTAGDNADETKWKTSEDKKGVSLADLGITTEAKDILVRTAATAKKIASKVGRITLKKAATGLTAPSGNKFGVTGGAITSGGAVVALVETTLAYDVKKGATIKNMGTDDLEYALITDGADNSKFKWTTLKAPKDPKKPTKGSLKYSNSAKANTWQDNEKTKLCVRVAGTKQNKENVATLASASQSAVLALHKIPQKLKLTAVDNDNIKIVADATTAAVKVATSTAVTVKFEGVIDKPVNPKGGTPKIKESKKINGVTFKAGKVDVATGKFEVTVNVSNKAFKDAVEGEIEFSLKYEGIDLEKAFKVKFEKKS